MSLEQYYTEEKVGERLVSLLPEFQPACCVELSAGEGALLLPVMKKWQFIDITTCELDGVNHAKLLNSITGSHYNVDVVAPPFEAIAKKYDSYFDLAVSNPPFSWRQNSNYEKSLLSLFGLNFMQSWKRVRSEVIFILQNLRLVKSFGYIAIILPELLVRSDTFASFRKHLISLCSVKAICEIEQGAFKGTEAKSYIVILKKEMSGAGFSYYSSDGDESLCNREDFLSLNNRTERCGVFSEQAKLLFDVRRGGQSGKQLKLSGKPYYHTSGFCEPGDVSEELGGKNFLIDKSKSVMARKGDVLLHRVGSRVIGKSMVVEQDSLVISDCVFRISVPLSVSPYDVSGYFERNESLVIKNARGTCAKYLTKADVVFYLGSFLEEKFFEPQKLAGYSFA